MLEEILLIWISEDKDILRTLKEVDGLPTPLIHDLSNSFDPREISSLRSMNAQSTVLIYENNTTTDKQ